MYIDNPQNKNQPESHTISVLVENRFGVLARVASLFSCRGYNIETLTVSQTLDPKISRMTIVTRGDSEVMEQIDKQLNKLIDVITVTNLSGTGFVERELVLFKVQFPYEDRLKVMTLISKAGAHVVIDHNDELGVEFSGNSELVKEFIASLSDYNIIELTQSGRVAISQDKGPTESYQVI